MNQNMITKILSQFLDSIKDYETKELKYICDDKRTSKEISETFLENCVFLKEYNDPNWIDVDCELPKNNVEITYMDNEGNIGTTYINCYGEWRCPITGSGKMIDVIKWRYLE